jgi:hypothetical protein
MTILMGKNNTRLLVLLKKTRKNKVRVPERGMSARGILEGTLRFS